MGNTNELVLIHLQMPTVSEKKNVNVMVTPQFYTLKRENIPVQYAYQAKRIAPSMFDGLLDEEGEYTYFVEKEEDTWLFIAYDDQKIKDFLITKEIDLEDVSKLYFVQQSLDKFTSPIFLGEKDALMVLDDVVVVVPQVVLENQESLLTFNNDFTPKKGLSLSTSSSTSSSAGAFLTQIQSLVLAGIFFIFAVLYTVEGLRYDGDSKAQEEEMRSLLKKYPALETSYTRNNLIKKYTKINTKERRKRDVVHSLSSMIFKGSTLSSLNMFSGKFKATFKCSDIKVVKKVKELAKKEKFKIAVAMSATEVVLEGAL